MTTERVPTIAEIVEKWWFVTQHPVSDRIISALEAREHEVLAAAKAEAAASALEQAASIEFTSEQGIKFPMPDWCVAAVRSLSPISNARAPWEADAERMAQQVAVMRIQLNAANDEIERLRGQVKELELQRATKPRYPTLDVRRYLKHLTGCSAYGKDEQACDCGVLRAEAKLEELAADAERMAQQFDAQHALLTRLAGSANEMKGMIERNELVRNTQADIKSDYIQRMMVFVQRLQKFDAAIAEAHAAGVVTE